MNSAEATAQIVYVVDDDDAVRRALSALLGARGFRVETFASAEHFLRALPATASGCVLSDIRMPGMSGLELQAELKRRGVGLPMVMITGHGDVPMAVKALKAGAVDFLEKPFDSDAILAAVEAGLRESVRRDMPPADEIAARFARLTPREREVMDLVVMGQPNKIIANRLNIALRTVEIHRSRVMEKAGARNLSELIRLALKA